MQSDFFSQVCKRIINKDVPHVVVDYLTGKSNYKKYVFVEGLDDKKFYSISLLKKIIHKFPGEIGYFICGCKSNVFESLSFLENNHYFSKNDVHFHIVDRDFDGLSNYNDKNNKELISMTKYYSIENYLFETKNFNLVLNYICNGDSEEKNSIIKDFNSFTGLLLDYEALLNCSVNKIIPYNVDGKTFNDKCLLYENENYYLEEEFYNYYTNIINKLSNDEIDNFNTIRNSIGTNLTKYRGHDLETIFDNVLKLHDIKLTTRDIMSNRKIVDLMEINLDLRGKNGYGKSYF